MDITGFKYFVVTNRREYPKIKENISLKKISTSTHHLDSKTHLHKNRMIYHAGQTKLWQ